MLSIPVIGTWTHWAVFGGDYPGEIIIPRFYSLHILLVPGIILALIAVHVALVWFQKHTQFPGPRRTENNVIGLRILPNFAAKGGGFFAVVFGITAIMGGVFQINPIWNLGPYNPSPSVGRRPAGLLHGLPRRHGPHMAELGDPKPVRALHGSGRVLPVDTRRPRVLMILVIAYPYIEKAFTKDNAIHNLLQRPRDVPVRTALGVAFMTFYIVNLINGANDLFAFKLDISLNVMTWVGRVLSIIGPVIAYVVTYRICLGLQHSDRAVLEHGIETGVIKRLPSGEFIEVHQPLGPVDDHGHAGAARLPGRGGAEADEPARVRPARRCRASSGRSTTRATSPTTTSCTHRRSSPAAGTSRTLAAEGSAPVVDDRAGPSSTGGNDGAGGGVRP